MRCSSFCAASAPQVNSTNAMHRNSDIPCTTRIAFLESLILLLPFCELIYGSVLVFRSPRRDGLAHSFKENFPHHAFVFVIEKMAVEERHAFDDRIGKIHDDVDRSSGWHVYGVQPHGVL